MKSYLGSLLSTSSALWWTHICIPVSFSSGTCLNETAWCLKADRWHVVGFVRCRTLSSLSVCLAELLCSVKSAHIVPADGWQMFYSWRTDSVHSLKHIPGFMKTAKDGGRRFERKADWLNSPVSAIPAFRWKGDFWQSVDVWASIWAHSSPANNVLIMKYKCHSAVFYTHPIGIIK